MKKLVLLSLLLCSNAFAQSFDGLPLPPNVSQETYDLIIGSDPTDPIYGCFPHYYHCALENSLLKGMVEVVEPTQPTDEAFNCTSIKTFREDRSLWKPVSNRGKPVVLLPCEYNDVKEVMVYSIDKKNLLAKGVSRNYCANEDRSHFDIAKTAKELGQNVLLVIAKQDGSLECRAVPNPEQRYE